MRLRRASWYQAWGVELGRAQVVIGVPMGPTLDAVGVAAPPPVGAPIRSTVEPSISRYIGGLPNLALEWEMLRPEVNRKDSTRIFRTSPRDGAETLIFGSIKGN